MTLKDAEGRTIRSALESTGGDKTKAARLLGISRTALYEKLKRMDGA
jgi:DNA-binding NtrC family response regulator